MWLNISNHYVHIYRKEENIQDFIVPEYWYKLLVWCENSALQAEYICAEHENKIDVSSNIAIVKCSPLCSTFSQKLFGILLKQQNQLLTG